MANNYRSRHSGPQIDTAVGTTLASFTADGHLLYTAGGLEQDLTEILKPINKDRAFGVMPDGTFGLIDVAKIGVSGSTSAQLTTTSIGINTTINRATITAYSGVLNEGVLITDPSGNMGVITSLNEVDAVVKTLCIAGVRGYLFSIAGSNMPLNNTLGATEIINRQKIVAVLGDTDLGSLVYDSEGHLGYISGQSLDNWIVRTIYIRTPSAQELMDATVDSSSVFRSIDGVTGKLKLTAVATSWAYDEVLPIGDAVEIDLTKIRPSSPAIDVNNKFNDADGKEYLLTAREDNRGLAKCLSGNQGGTWVAFYTDKATGNLIYFSSYEDVNSYFSVRTEDLAIVNYGDKPEIPPNGTLVADASGRMAVVVSYTEPTYSMDNPDVIVEPARNGLVLLEKADLVVAVWQRTPMLKTMRPIGTPVTYTIETGHESEYFTMLNGYYPKVGMLMASQTGALVEITNIALDDDDPTITYYQGVTVDMGPACGIFETDQLEFAPECGDTVKVYFPRDNNSQYLLAPVIGGLYVDTHWNIAICTEYDADTGEYVLKTISTPGAGTDNKANKVITGGTIQLVRELVNGDTIMKATVTLDNSVTPVAPTNSSNFIGGDYDRNAGLGTYIVHWSTADAAKWTPFQGSATAQVNCIYQMNLMEQFGAERNTYVIQDTLFDGSNWLKNTFTFTAHDQIEFQKYDLIGTTSNVFASNNSNIKEVEYVLDLIDVVTHRPALVRKEFLGLINQGNVADYKPFSLYAGDLLFYPNAYTINNPVRIYSIDNDFYIRCNVDGSLDIVWNDAVHTSFAGPNEYNSGYTCLGYSAFDFNGIVGDPADVENIMRNNSLQVTTSEKFVKTAEVLTAISDSVTRASRTIQVKQQNYKFIREFVPNKPQCIWRLISPQQRDLPTDAGSALWLDAWMGRGGDTNIYYFYYATGGVFLTTLETLNTGGGWTRLQDNVMAQDIVDIKTKLEQGGIFIGQSFATKAALLAFTVPSWVSTGDFTFVQADESKSGRTTRYTWNASNSTWNYTYTLGMDFTTAQMDAINSGITSALVTQITTNKNNITSNATAIGNEATRASNAEALKTDKKNSVSQSVIDYDNDNMPSLEGCISGVGRTSKMTMTRAGVSLAACWGSDIDYAVNVDDTGLHGDRNKSPTFVQSKTIPANDYVQGQNVLDQTQLERLYRMADITGAFEDAYTVVRNGSAFTFTPTTAAKRFVWIPVDKKIASAGYIGIRLPASTSIAGLGGHAAITTGADSSITLQSWDGLIYRHTIGGNQETGTFYVFAYNSSTSGLLQPNDLLVLVNCNGMVLKGPGGCVMYDANALKANVVLDQKLLASNVLGTYTGTYTIVGGANYKQLVVSIQHYSKNNDTDGAVDTMTIPIDILTTSDTVFTSQVNTQASETAVEYLYTNVFALKISGNDVIIRGIRKGYTRVNAAGALPTWTDRNSNTSYIIASIVGVAPIQQTNAVLETAIDYEKVTNGTVTGECWYDRRTQIATYKISNTGNWSAGSVTTTCAFTQAFAKPSTVIYLVNKCVDTTNNVFLRVDTSGNVQVQTTSTYIWAGSYTASYCRATSGTPAKYTIVPATVISVDGKLTADSGKYKAMTTTAPATSDWCVISRPQHTDTSGYEFQSQLKWLFQISDAAWAANGNNVIQSGEFSLLQSIGGINSTFANNTSVKCDITTGGLPSGEYCLVYYRPANYTDEFVLYYRGMAGEGAASIVMGVGNYRQGNTTTWTIQTGIQGAYTKGALPSPGTAGNIRYYTFRIA